ncbi:hypothetical protein A9G28_06675 [Gilliamella sp. Fer1-1]|uniref:isocitrate lyase/PEP mutase family protein n=1 Tax=Gilliamella sp. Fer1-1 TaxID=3120240 RepID=UPI00080EDFEC|nr:isocitrate lyase/phosphoenolpyruvate mutase family protein [Gilliamella apicola]OCG41193.1 hypothetical protein A9G28_06675 [Gilliamella apicola]OCG41498.1 hypothetical protein A9G29_00710 [Gilliamella apicola]
MNYSTFKALHSKKSFFVLANCWDVLSARIYEKAGYKALGTSSSALSATNNVKDGENITFYTVLHNAQNILKVVKIPLSVDMEKGYSSRVTDIVDNVIKLADIGCSGINIEDSQISGSLQSPTNFSRIISLIKSTLLAKGFPHFVLNARTDTYLSPYCHDKLTETMARASVYKSAGADCLFVPGLSNLNEIREISDEIALPLNILNLPNISNIDDLQLAGVNRFSLGNSVFDEMLAYLEKSINRTIHNKNYASHYSHDPLNLLFN